MQFINQFLNEAKEIIDKINEVEIEKIIDYLVVLKKQQGRLFFLGNGGSAANASHAVNDFRKIVGIEAYTPTDNVSELTARTNDEGWHLTFVQWLKVSCLNHNDIVFILSVGGGNQLAQVSSNLNFALDYAKQKESKIVGIVGRDGGYTAKVADACVCVPTVNNLHITPHVEAFQAIIWHLIVSHPKLKQTETKWESIEKKPCNIEAL